MQAVLLAQREEERIKREAEETRKRNREEVEENRRREREEADRSDKRMNQTMQMYQLQLMKNLFGNSSGNLSVFTATMHKFSL